MFFISAAVVEKYSNTDNSKLKLRPLSIFKRISINFYFSLSFYFNLNKMTFIKPDPEMQEEQEDLIMSYLNTDYLTEQPLSPPDSTTSSETTGSPDKHSVDIFSPEKQLVDEFMFDPSLTTTATEHDFFNQNWLTSVDPSQPSFYNNSTPDTAALLNTFPFYVPSLPQQTPVEQPKKKRGRKKRDSVQPTVTTPPSLLAPKPLAPKPAMEEIVKIEMMEEPVIMAEETPKKPEIKVEQQMTQEAQKQLQIQKRQERLIKNRAAALLSRKRKREHLNNLEDENKKLMEENQQLTDKVTSLEDKIQLLEKENMELKSKLYPTHHYNKKPTTKATSVVFMIMLFSFALFSLPSRSSTNQLTVGGTAYKKQFPLIEQQQQQQQPATDLILIDSVRPRDLQTWINHKLDVSQQEEEITHWQTDNKSQVYLYSKEFSQLASRNQPPHLSLLPPLISIFSPYNQTVEEEQCDSYLQIDVQVLRSSVIKGQLFSLEKYPSIGLLDGIKNEYINNNVTRSNQDNAIVKREKRTKKLSKVL